MKKDLNIEPVKGVTVAVVKRPNDTGEVQWLVYLLNTNDFELTNVMVASKGYGIKDDEEQKTSVLRHVIEQVDAQGAALIEPIMPDVFHLNNEYWVSYYAGTKIFDKKFVFVPDSIVEENIRPLPLLNEPGILHE